MKHTAKASIQINAPVANVWQALTDPDLIKQYFFGVDVITDWKKGSPIIYKGEWEGKAFEEKGTVLDVEPEKFLYTNYWSVFSGLPDEPENYQSVSYDLESDGDTTTLTVTQGDIPTKEAAEHSQKNWEMVLNGLKDVAEKLK
jgi:uncharacterized protein YndB with AHSA1/START domain